MASLRTHFIYPSRLYHGTRIDPDVGVQKALEQFCSRLLNPEYWKNGKDFGRGFYTTLDLSQAQQWALRGMDQQKRLILKIPLVLEIEWNPYHYVSDYHGMIEHLIFPGASLEWAKYILDHRMNSRCSCKKKHPAIIIGPAADNSGLQIRTLVSSYKQQSHSHYFLDGITKTPYGKQLTDLQLNNQVVFCSEIAQPTLKILGFYTWGEERQEWNYVRI